MKGTVLALAAAAFASAQPISLHPENPDYFLFQGKPAVLVTSGEHYGAVLIATSITSAISTPCAPST
jgi:hypothetical protein